MRILLAVLLSALLLVPAAMAQVPRTVIAEDLTATWCVYCPDAYAGLEVMKSRYDANEFTSVRYYDTSGALGNAKTHGRVVYYNVTGFPTVVFDGTTPVVGGGSTVATGAVYDPIVAREIGLPSPLSIRINNYTLTGPMGSVNFDLQVVQTIPDISNTKIRVLVLENNVLWNNQHETDVVRSMLDDVAMSVSLVGQDQNVALTFPIDPSWKTNDLWIAVFVQNDTDKSILQSDSTRPTPVHSLRYWAEGPRADVAPSNGTYEFPNFAVYNMGTSADNFTVAVNNNHLPAGWSCVFTDGTNDYTTTTVSLNPGESRIYHLKVTPNSPGYVDTKIVLSEDQLPGVQRNIGYTLSTNDVQVLLVKHDGGDNLESYYIDGLQAYGATFGLWNENYSDVTAQSMSTYPVVVWECGFAFPTLSGGDRDALNNYLSNGGNLFLTGEDIAWDLGANQGASANSWMQQWLHTDYANVDQVGVWNLTGMSGDPISNGMAISISGGDGANNQTDQDAIQPHTGDPTASTVFTYNGTSYIGGVKANTGTYKTVFLSFGYEAVSTQANRRLLMQRVLDWFNLPAAAPDAGAFAKAATIEAAPNPTRDVSTLRFSLPSAETATLQVYDLNGALVRTLVNGARPAGSQSVVWDGRNNAGERVGSGVYLYRLKAGDAAPGGKVVISR